MVPPIHYFHPQDIVKTLEYLILNTSYRNILGRNVASFIKAKCSQNVVARKYLKLIRDEIPEDWMLDPNNVIYLHGCGQSEVQTKKILSSLINAHGISSLGLSHNPNLEVAFLKLSGLK
jgi:hypothetical protein